jgi:hypothetical protein
MKVCDVGKERGSDEAAVADCAFLSAQKLGASTKELQALCSLVSVDPHDEDIAIWISMVNLATCEDNLYAWSGKCH